MDSGILYLEERQKKKSAYDNTKNYTAIQIAKKKSLEILVFNHQNVHLKQKKNNFNQKNEHSKKTIYKIVTIIPKTASVFKFFCPPIKYIIKLTVFAHLIKNSLYQYRKIHKEN